MTRRKATRGTPAAAVLANGILGWRERLERPHCPCGCGALGMRPRGSSYGWVFDCAEANADRSKS